MFLGEVGIDLAPLLAGAGVVGVAIGFGSQSLVQATSCPGLFILVEDQFGVGDIVDLGEAYRHRGGRLACARRGCARRRHGLAHAQRRDPRVGNMSQHWSRALLDIEVAYDTDIAHARA